VTRRLARDESGFSLVELLTAVSIGLVIMFAAMTLLDLSAKGQRRTADRVEAVQSGRILMDQIVARLRSQLCPGTATSGVEDPAVQIAEKDRIAFYGSFAGAPTVSGRVQLQRREISFVPTSSDRGNVVERVWNAPYTSTNPKPVPPPITATPDSVRTLATNIAREKSGIAFFRYRKYNAPNSPDMTELTAPVTDPDARALIVQVDVAFDAFPAVGADSRLRTSYVDQAFVRTADPTDPTHSPRCL